MGVRAGTNSRDRGDLEAPKKMKITLETKRTFAIAAVVVVILVIVTFLLKPTKAEMTRTEAVKTIEAAVQTYSKEAASIDKIVKQKVVTIREEAKREAIVCSADDIARGIRDELVLFLESGGGDSGGSSYISGDAGVEGQRTRVLF